VIYKISRIINTPRLGQRDYFQLSILFKRQYMDILNFQLFQRGYLNYTGQSMAICPRHSG